MKLFCCECGKEVNTRLTDGKEIYPHREDLFHLPFWICDACKNYVGCHHKTLQRTKPLGCIPNKKIKEARKHIHKVLDPLWKSRKTTRPAAYYWLSKRLGVKNYHTAEIRTIEQARRVYRLVLEYRKVISFDDNQK